MDGLARTGLSLRPTSNMEELYPGYLWQVPVTEDIRAWNQLWPMLEKNIIEEAKGKVVNSYWPRTTALYHSYNIFTMSDPSIKQLHSVIGQTLRQLHPGQHYNIRGWLNVLRDQNTLDWHTHITDIIGGMHGYMSITSEPSVTVYRIGEDLLNVKNRNGHMVIGYCNRDQHRTTPVPGEVPRVSVAFDIMPTSYTLPTEHWAPL